MQSIFEKFQRSAKMSKNLRVLAITALLVALNLILDRFRIQITPTMRISFSFVTTAAAGMLFGPVVAMTCGFTTDVVSYLMAPQSGAYFPGYTFTAVLAGLIYGLVLYREKLTIWRALLAKGLINLICNIGLNTVWSAILYGQAVQAILPARVIKNLAMLPIETVFLFVLCGIIEKVYNRSGHQLS